MQKLRDRQEATTKKEELFKNMIYENREQLLKRDEEKQIKHGKEKDEKDRLSEINKKIENEKSILKTREILQKQIEDKQKLFEAKIIADREYAMKIQKDVLYFALIKIKGLRIPKTAKEKTRRYKGKISKLR